VALCRDQLGDTRELHLNEGDHAIVLSLSGRPIREWSLDGRHDDNAAVRWEFADYVSIKWR
jgi:hypothetical protein